MKGHIFRCAVKLFYSCHLERASARERPAFSTFSATSSVVPMSRLFLSSRGGLQPDEGSAVPDNRQLTTFFRAFREKEVVEIESEWTARDRELKMFGSPARTFLNPDARFVSGHDFSRADKLIFLVIASRLQPATPDFVQFANAAQGGPPTKCCASLRITWYRRRRLPPSPTRQCSNKLSKTSMTFSGKKPAAPPSSTTPSRPPGCCS